MKRKPIKYYLANAETLRKNYRMALLRLGKSPDYHIYDIPDSFLSQFPRNGDARLLRNLKDLYYSLDQHDRDILIFDILEANRHYPFWFYDGGFAKNEYDRRKTQLLVNLPRVI